MGLELGTSRWQSQKVDYTGNSTTSDVAVMMTFLFVLVEDEERAVGVLVVGGVLA